MYSVKMASSQKQTSTELMYKEICTRLKKDKQFVSTMEHIQLCQGDLQRLELVYNIPVVEKVVSKSILRQKNGRKSDDESLGQRKKGNSFFQKKDYQKALDLYTESALLATWNSVTYFQDLMNQKEQHKEDRVVLATAYANRSAANFYLGQYSACLLDIDLALKCGYPKESSYKLYERQGNCYVQLGQRNKAIDSFNCAIEYVKQNSLQESKQQNILESLRNRIDRCGDPIITKKDGMVDTSLENINKFHSAVPNIDSSKKSNVFLSSSNAVGIRESAEMGHGLAATRNVEAGEILVVEKPYSSVVLQDMERTYCHHCCNRVIVPIPCCKCSHIVYCSMGCQKESWDCYHHVECDILPIVQEADMKLGHLALRMVIKASLSYLLSTKNDYLSSENLNIVGYGEDGKYRSDDYHAVYHLVRHSNLRTPEDLFERAVRATFLLKCLDQTSFFRETKCSGNDMIFTGSHILRYLQMLPCNAHEISELKWKPGEALESHTVEVGSGIYATLSLINHSCDPNVVRHSYGSTCVVRAIKQIKEGEEIVDNYGALYAVTVREERREKLKPQYYFDCNCEACQMDLPTYFDIPVDSPVFKCENCDGPIFISIEKKDLLNNQCRSCKSVQDLSRKIFNLRTLEEKYKSALEQVLQGRCSNRALRDLLAFLKVCSSDVCLPWREFNNCQEAVKQCYAVQANCFELP